MTLTNNTRTFGIEIEFFGASADDLVAALYRRGIDAYFAGYTHEVVDTWKIVTDSSVCGDGGQTPGLELVSPPMAGEHGLEQIRLVCDALQEVGAKVNKTCGLHIHHHADDYKPQNFKNLISLYSKADKVLDRMMPKSRRKSFNQYCNSLVLDANEYSHQREFDHEDVISNGRYYKVNLNSFYKYGTVEFRHHGGTIEADKIINWVDLTQRMVLRAKRRVPAWNGHSLTWFDVKQALGLVHNAGQREMDLVAYCEGRMAALV